MNEPWRQHTFVTISGRRVRPYVLQVADVHIPDAAHSLARQCRFTGHVEAIIYSVAQHSVHVGEYIFEKTKDARRALAGVGHDFAETYFGDINRVVKQHPAFKEFIEAEIDKAQGVCNVALGLDPLAHEDPIVIEADSALAWAEMRDLKDIPDQREFHVLGESCPAWERRIVAVDSMTATAMYLDAMQRYRAMLA